MRVRDTRFLRVCVGRNRQVWLAGGAVSRFTIHALYYSHFFVDSLRSFHWGRYALPDTRRDGSWPICIADTYRAFERAWVNQFRAIDDWRLARRSQIAGIGPDRTDRANRTAKTTSLVGVPLMQGSEDKLAGG